MNNNMNSVLNIKKNKIKPLNNTVYMFNIRLNLRVLRVWVKLDITN